MGARSNRAGFLPSLLCLVVFSIPSVCINPSQYCGDGVQTAIGSFTFNGTASDDYWGNLCTNELGSNSMGAAMKTYCTSSELAPSWQALEEYCTENGLSLPSWADLVPILTDEFIQSLQVVEFDDIDETKIWNHSVLLSRSLYKASYRTTTVFEKEYRLHMEYGWAVYGFWGIILLAGMFNRAIVHLSGLRYSKAVDAEAAARMYNTKKRSDPILSAQQWVQKHLTIPPVFGSYHQERLWTCAVPTRLESVVLAAYWILNLVLCCVTYEVFYPNLYYTKPIQVWRYVADRTGILAYANLPWLWMFSGRNNVFISLTGWSFSTFNLFHRHIARVATIQAIVHSVAYTAIEINYDYLAESWKEQYWYMGGIATIAMSLLLGLSSFWLRRHAYEVFLLIHIAFAVLIIVGLFYHTKIFEGEYDGYLWPLVAIWSFDRFARLVRLVYCNVHLLFSSNPLAAKATIAYNKDANILTLEVPVSGPSRPQLAAGQHYYIYQPTMLKFWENHPFTLASWNSVHAAALAASSPAQNLGKLTAKHPELTPASPTSSPATSSSPPSISNQDSSSETVTAEGLTFLIRPYATSGFTHRLLQACLSSPTRTTTARLLIEGPYGVTHPLHAYETLLLIVGGSGISAALPYLLDYVASTANEKSEKATSSRMWRATHITLVWTTREPAMLQQIAEQHMQPLLHREDVRWHFHATSKNAVEQLSALAPVSVTDSANPGRGSASEKGKLESIGVGIVDTPQAEVPYAFGRPDIAAIVREAVEGQAEAGLRGGRVGVFACGPASMSDTARAAALEAMRATRDREVEVGYFEEEFGW